MISTRVHSSSTSCSRWELRTTAAPAWARPAMVRFIRRIPTGSSPVSGSSSIRARGSCSSPQAMASFCFMPRESSLASASCFSASSSSSSKRRDPRQRLRLAGRAGP